MSQVTHTVEDSSWFYFLLPFPLAVFVAQRERALSYSAAAMP